MRRTVFVTLALVVVLSSFSTAFAAEPQQTANPATLGDVWWFYFDFGVPNIRVDAYLYRPSTEAGWPFAGGPDWGTWWWTGPDSAQRRQSWPSYQFTDVWGYYYAEFMLPRDEVWYPCGFPLNWKCNYINNIEGELVWEYHSPYEMLYECRNVGPFIVECLEWPWTPDPQDTVSPLQVWLIDEYGFAYIIDFEVLGMYWKYSDFED